MKTWTRVQRHAIKPLMSWPPSLDAARAALRDVFRHPDFRGLQASAIQSLLDGKDTVVLMPTGAGKSVCFQVPAILAARAGRGTTLCISPLIALMEDQVRGLSAHNVLAACLHSMVDELEQLRTESRFTKGELDVLYVSPERLGAPSFQRLLKRSKVPFLIVDEAHCVSQWGHDFRPDYAAISERIADFRALGMPVLALTASATPEVLDDVTRMLQLRAPNVFRGGVARPNLNFSVSPLRTDAERTNAAIELLETLGFRNAVPPGRAILYCATRKRVDSTHEELSSRGLAIGRYHAGMTDLQREKAQKAFTLGRTPILVATNAFGMGVDQPDVRCVLHLQAPGSLEAYYQEAGRAGRDGAPSRCVLMFGASDIRTQQALHRKGRVTPQLMRIREASLTALNAYAHTPTCRQAQLIAHFSDVDPARIPACASCDVCRDPALVAEMLAQNAPKPRRTVNLSAVPSDDVTKVLEAVEALRRPVGKTLLARALRGSNAADIRKKGLLRHPLHGALERLDEDTIVAILDRLLSDGKIVRKGVKYPTVWAAGRTVRAVADAAAPRGARRAARERGSPLEQALTRWRRKQARALGWKLYMVMSNATLKAIAQRRPFTTEDLLAIKGMGPARLDRFGVELLRLIATQ